MSRSRRLEPGEWERLEAACRQCRNPYVVDVVEFALETAMRYGEVINMRWKDVSLKTRTLHIPLTKNGHPRTIPLSYRAMAILERLMILKRQEDQKVFPVTYESAKMAWRRIQKRANLDDFHFHDLRHEAISRFFEKGLNIPEVALISGHRDPRMLLRYTHPRPEDIAEKLAKATG
jgi:integrase